MRICQYNVALDDTGRNVLVRDSAKNYAHLDRLDSTDRTVLLMRDMFQLHIRAEEYLYLICTNTKNKPIGFFEISHGTCNTTLANPREMLIRALLCGAACILLVHNHPSGDPTPSRADDTLTKRVWEAAELIGIELCDHIIIGGCTYYSYKAAGALRREGAGSIN